MYTTQWTTTPFLLPYSPVLTGPGYSENPGPAWWVLRHVLPSPQRGSRLQHTTAVKGITFKNVNLSGNVEKEEAYVDYKMLTIKSYQVVDLCTFIEASFCSRGLKYTGTGRFILVSTCPPFATYQKIKNKYQSTVWFFIHTNKTEFQAKWIRQFKCKLCCCFPTLYLLGKLQPCAVTRPSSFCMWALTCLYWALFCSLRDGELHESFLQTKQRPADAQYCIWSFWK